MHEDDAGSPRHHIGVDGLDPAKEKLKSDAESARMSRKVNVPRRFRIRSESLRRLIGSFLSTGSGTTGHFGSKIIVSLFVARALSIVTSSTNSRSLPTGIPIAMRVTSTPSGFSSRAM